MFIGLNEKRANTSAIQKLETIPLFGKKHNP